MSVLRVALVDDERPARARMRRLLSSLPDLEIVAEADDGPTAVSAIRQFAPDLVFLDIRMPGLDGFGVLEALDVDRLPQIVFVTAFDEHAIRAFEVHAIDYLLKPVESPRLAEAVGRARQLRSQTDGTALLVRMEQALAELAPRPRFLRRLLVEAGPRTLFLPVDQINLVDADRNCVRLVTSSGEYRLRMLLGELGERLDPARFLQINRSQIVRLDAVTELHPWSHGDYHILLHDGTTLTWSRRYRSESLNEFGRGG